MPTNKGSPESVKKPFLRRLRGDRTQPSLFHYIREEPEGRIWADLDFSFFRHPIRVIREEWQDRGILTTLFSSAVSGAQSGQSQTWRQYLHELFSRSNGPWFLPSLFSNPWELLIEEAATEQRKRRSVGISAAIHIVVVILLVALVHKTAASPPTQEEVVFVKGPQMYFPFESTGPDGGGGGGGGKNEKTPPSGGRMPDTSRVQMVAPSPDSPKPLLPPDDLNNPAPTVQMPIDIPQDTTLPIGDITAPPSDLRSSGPGSGGGIGTGRGTGVGPGSGPGVGPGSGGGMGGGSGGGIGSGVGPYVVGGGVSSPVPIVQPLPLYTEEAQKARIEGIVLIQATIRRDGTVDSFRVIRGLGYGLDESAINTIATKWRFRPGTMNGRPVDVQANIEVTFRLY